MKRYSTKNPIIIKKFLLSALFAAIISLSSSLSIPFFESSFTVQTLSVYVALFVLGGKYGTLSIAIYIFLGAIGLPVFSGFSGGLGRLFDITGGFIFGFLFAGLSYWLLCFVFKSNSKLILLFAIISHVVLYAFGVGWYSVFYGENILSAILIMVLPFVTFDAIKLAAAFLISNRLKKYILVHFE